MTSNTYDIVIIGAGMAGLYAGLELVKRQPKLRVCIADRYKFIGGRAFTYKATVDGVDYQWEEGGARISTKHQLVMELMKKYKMTKVPIESTSDYKESGAYPIEKPLFDECRAIYLTPLEELPTSVLGSTTIRGLLKKLVKPAELETFLLRYPYRAEFGIMRADMALRVFREEFAATEKYVICGEGLSELVQRMRADFEGRGGTVLVQHELVEMRDDRHAVFKKGAPSEGESRPEVVLEAPKFIFAIPLAAIKKIAVFKGWPVLRYLTMAPLLRLYAVFPVGANGKPWFEGLPKIVTAQAPRYIIPNNSKNGSIQISYTDSEDTAPLLRILDSGDDGEEKLGKKIVEDLRTLFGDRNIPDPKFVKAYPWKDGVTYWLPGDYDPYVESRRAIHPFPKEHPGWFVCGESFSSRQCWIEGALEHAKDAVKYITRQ
jgi:hypothetical protein